MSMFSDYRKNRLAAISNSELKKAGIAAECLLNIAIGECFPQIKLPMKISQSSCGKPESDGVFFNLSHSGNFSACAVSDEPIGLDIQKQVCYNDSLVKRFFTKQEYMFLRDSKDKDHDFTSLWCLKESYLKAIGTGLTKPLNSFSIKKTGNKFAFDDGRFALWHSVIDGINYDSTQDPKPQITHAEFTVAPECYCCSYVIYT